MIDLTPLEVRKKKGDFPRAVRGYDRPLVDDFLDLVSERLEELVKENRALAERLVRIEEELAGYKERERSLTEALVSAQELREEVRRQSAKDAELVRREAEVSASDILSNAAKAREREEEGLRRLRARRAQLISSYRTFLEREVAELSALEEGLELDVDDAAAPISAKKRTGSKATAGKGAATEGSGAANAKSEADWLASVIDEEQT